MHNSILIAAAVILKLPIQQHGRPPFPDNGTRDDMDTLPRCSEAREQFMRGFRLPHGRPGYVVDHIIPLKRGARMCRRHAMADPRPGQGEDKWE